MLDLGFAPESLSVTAAAGLVVVSRASVPGLRRLEATLAEMDGAGRRPVAAVVGGPVRRWPRILRHAIGPRTERLMACGRLVGVPVDSRLRLTGLTATALPPAVVKAGAALLNLTKETL